MLHQIKWSHLSLLSVASNEHYHRRTLSENMITILFCIPAPRTGAVTNHLTQSQVLEIWDEVPRNTPDSD
ncbi:hypothetical protein EPI10_032551 [Gossypium australe]|uniref:Uncharacterized protein n=1 Tax=Gossypium australe TaxID=47621 RepID=A0A5B6X5F5_9ROSI|nr:hypothetical protein EPI10_032551 [Gossypium australe]